MFIHLKSSGFCCKVNAQLLASVYYAITLFHCWPCVCYRTGQDPTLQESLRSLGTVIAEQHQRNVEVDIHVERSQAIQDAFVELCRWAVSCAAHPRRWDQYCAWPSHLRLEYFDSITADEEAALVLVVYWCTLLYRAPQPSVYLWAYRTARYAMQKRTYNGMWQGLLIWPIRALNIPREGVSGVSWASTELDRWWHMPPTDSHRPILIKFQLLKLHFACV